MVGPNTVTHEQIGQAMIRWTNILPLGEREVEQMLEIRKQEARGMEAPSSSELKGSLANAEAFQRMTREERRAWWLRRMAALGMQPTRR